MLYPENDEGTGDEYSPECFAHVRHKRAAHSAATTFSSLHEFDRCVASNYAPAHALFAKAPVFVKHQTGPGQQLTQGEHCGQPWSYSSINMRTAVYSSNSSHDR